MKIIYHCKEYLFCDDCGKMLSEDERCDCKDTIKLELRERNKAISKAMTEGVKIGYDNGIRDFIHYAKTRYRLDLTYVQNAFEKEMDE